ncbi:hypothetical protein BDF19DRAFT_466212 [Syncephalis fuscata]|nr:hypothetical protein BDF19DRAFT_466212 [Syncephalis fuscata]
MQTNNQLKYGSNGYSKKALSFSLSRWPMLESSKAPSKATFGLLGAALYTGKEQGRWQFQSCIQQHITINTIGLPTLIQGSIPPVTEQTALCTTVPSTRHGKVIATLDISKSHVACPSYDQLNCLTVYRDSVQPGVNQWSPVARYQLKKPIQEVVCGPDPSEGLDLLAVREDQTITMLGYRQNQTYDNPLFKIDTLKFKDTPQSVALNPHIYGETIISTGSTIFHWDSERMSDGIIPIFRIQDQSLKNNAEEQRAGCQFGLHPRVVWLANNKQLFSLDLRSKNTRATQQFAMNSSERFVDLVCGVAKPALNALATTQNIYLFDERLASKPLVTWEARRGLGDRLGSLNAITVKARGANTHSIDQPLLLRSWSETAEITVLPLYVGSSVPSIESSMDLKSFRDYYNFHDISRAEHALAHVNLKHSRDAYCSPPSLVDFNVKSIIVQRFELESMVNMLDDITMDNIKAHYDNLDAEYDSSVDMLQMWQLASNGTLFQQLYMIDYMNQSAEILNSTPKSEEVLFEDRVININTWPKNDPSVKWMTKKKHLKLERLQNALNDLPQLINTFATNIPRRLVDNISMPLDMVKQQSAIIAEESKYPITLHELLAKLTKYEGTDVSETALWKSVGSLSVNDPDYILSEIPLPMSKALVLKPLNKVWQFKPLVSTYGLDKANIREIIYNTFSVDKESQYDVYNSEDAIDFMASTEQEIADRIADEVWLATHTWWSLSANHNSSTSKKSEYSQKTQDTFTWFSPLDSTQPDNIIADEKCLQQSTGKENKVAHHASNKQATSFNFQSIKPTLTEAALHRMSQQHRQPQLVSDAAQVLLRDWQQSDSSTKLPLLTHHTSTNTIKRVASVTVPPSRKAGNFHSELSSSVPNVISSPAYSSIQKTPAPIRQMTHTAGFGKSPSISSTAGAPSRVPFANVKVKHQSMSQPNVETGNASGSRSKQLPFSMTQPSSQFTSSQSDKSKQLKQRRKPRKSGF